VLDEADLAVFRERVLEALPIVRGSADWRESDALVAWAVRCAVEPATRWDGLLSLQGGYEWEGGPAGLVTRLDRDQRLALCEAVRVTPVPRIFEVLLIDMLEDFPDVPLEESLLERLRAEREDPPRMAVFLLHHLADRWDDAEARRIVEAYGKAGAGTDEGSPSRRELLDAFLANARARGSATK
jgi:hypothetical protein